MASREDLSLFKVKAWCVDDELVPVAKSIWIPEPLEVVEQAGRRAPRFR